MVLILDEAHCAPPVIDPYALLDDLLANNTINKGQKNALTKKLDKCNITPFKNQVNAFVNNGTLTQAEADDLIAGIENVCAGARISDSQGFELQQNYPNPTEDFTVIPFTLSQMTNVSLQLFDLTGRLVKVILNETMMEGEYQIKVDLQELPQGTYFYRMEANGRVETLPMVKK